MDSDKGRIYRLNRQSGELWKFYYDGFQKEEIIQICCRKYNTEASIIQNDVDAFLEFLEKNEII